MIADELFLHREADIMVAAVEDRRDLIAGEARVYERPVRVTLELRQECAVFAEPQEEVGQAGLLCRL